MQIHTTLIKQYSPTYIPVEQTLEIPECSHVYKQILGYNTKSCIYCGNFKNYYEIEVDKYFKIGHNTSVQ